MSPEDQWFVLKTLLAVGDNYCKKIDLTWTSLHWLLLAVEPQRLSVLDAGKIMSDVGISRKPSDLVSDSVKLLRAILPVHLKAQKRISDLLRRWAILLRKKQDKIWKWLKVHKLKIIIITVFAAFVLMTVTHRFHPVSLQKDFKIERIWLLDKNGSEINPIIVSDGSQIEIYRIGRNDVVNIKLAVENPSNRDLESLWTCQCAQMEKTITKRPENVFDASTCKEPGPDGVSIWIRDKENGNGIGDSYFIHIESESIPLARI